MNPTSRLNKISERALNLITFGLSTVIGIFILLYPFVMPALIENTPIGSARVKETPLTLTLLLGLSLLIVLYEVQGRTFNTKLIALLGMLVAINASLRFIEAAVPGPAGFSPIFLLIILTGYIYGSRFGFLMGAMTLFVSALVTGGVGPWLPGQMFAAGWAGMSAPICAGVIGWLNKRDNKWEIFILTLFSVFWGLLFGLIMNMWSWPFIMGLSNQSWAQGVPWYETLKNYSAYYMASSFFWDVVRAAGNGVLMVFFGGAILRSLRRFHHRFHFDYQPNVSSEGAGG